jgi:hypothetical protein
MRYFEAMETFKVKSGWSAWRVGRVVIYVGILVALIIYGKVANPDITLKMCLDNPERYDGVTIEVGGEATVGERLRDGFTIVYLGEIVRVKGTHPHLRKREYLSLIAVFHKEGPWLEAIDIHIARYRRMKIALSILPVIAVGLLFVKRYRFDFGCLEFRERM